MPIDAQSKGIHCRRAVQRFDCLRLGALGWSSPKSRFNCFAIDAHTRVCAHCAVSNVYAHAHRATCALNVGGEHSTHTLSIHICLARWPLGAHVCSFNTFVHSTMLHNTYHLTRSRNNLTHFVRTQIATQRASSSAGLCARMDQAAATPNILAHSRT